MVRPISEQIAPSIASTFSDVSPIKSNVSLLSRSSLSSHCGSSLSFLGYCTSAWQWIKTHIFCCFSKASQETSETTDTCPIPVVTEGNWFNKEINKQIRALHELEIPNQPDWAAFPKDAALFFHEISEEIETRDEDSPDLDLDDRINEHFNFPGMDKAMDFRNSDTILPKETIPFFYSFFTTILRLEMKNSVVNIPIPETQTIPEPGDNFPMPLLSGGQKIDIEINNNIRSLYQIEIKNHPEWTLYPQSLAIFFSRIAQELDSGEFTTNVDPLNELKIDERMKALPFHKEVEDALKSNSLKIPHEEIDNFPFQYIFVKTYISLMFKAKMVQQEQQTERE